MAGRLGPSLIRCVLSRFIRAKGAFVFIAITVIGTALSYAMPYVNGKFLDFLLGNRSERDAALFALLVASIGVFSTLFTYFAGTLSIRISTRLSFDLLREAVLRFERDDYLVSGPSIQPIQRNGLFPTPAWSHPSFWRISSVRRCPL